MTVENMAPNARKAYEELLEMGIPVYARKREEAYSENAQFSMHWANETNTEIYADMNNSRKYYEYRNDLKSKYIAGFREDIHLVLKKYKLVTDWYDASLVLVYKTDDPGLSHHNEKLIEKYYT